ncbi:MAG TPA: Crp/Fnr family transcriptional regulator [Cyanobacteria bacterium UBA11149]|nr:Crp/Fnr family transcriptional regulator [Cyanobacteria bacterium UBA11367]HBE60510.1 Crp/Fnr family transcriptional regulator [Cyanobacteria bacterium UBA11366]HBK62534.1 Crp/Fnr family transcriptional regulator [Cyanobacteria bacterium UBA11166]HBR75068.1 Crp/Fnr family transcriptional regulator [Cyanobacteria bacterium UBA11159]HBS71269.1 Crp/Fnr family transcriptional regulator [Cyanobacteria bacterium UBA11153]HBW89779.1 Crp/Fnr family transcriptional regulator [Cyanobacteria bacterium
MKVLSFSPNPPMDRTKQLFPRRSLLSPRHDYLWVIQSGVVRTRCIQEDGNIVTLGLWGSGDVVGRILHKSNSYAMECLTPVVASLIPKDRWHEFTEAMIHHIQHSGELMEIIRCRQAESSILRLLNWLGNRFGQKVEEGQLIDLRLTHQDIADLLGITRVTVTRLLKTFEQQGIIQRVQRQLILSNDQLPFWHYEI